MLAQRAVERVEHGLDLAHNLLAAGAQMRIVRLDAIQLQQLAHDGLAQPSVRFGAAVGAAPAAAAVDEGPHVRLQVHGDAAAHGLDGPGRAGLGGLGGEVLGGRVLGRHRRRRRRRRRRRQSGRRRRRRRRRRDDEDACAVLDAERLQGGVVVGRVEVVAGAQQGQGAGVASQLGALVAHVAQRERVRRDRAHRVLEQVLAGAVLDRQHVFGPVRVHLVAARQPARPRLFVQLCAAVAGTAGRAGGGAGAGTGAPQAKEAAHDEGGDGDQQGEDAERRNKVDEGGPGAGHGLG